MAIVLDGTNGITNVDGSAAAPAFKNQDTNTGLSGSADQIVVSTGGSERFRVASAGQLGVAGANYGTDGQVLTSTGASSAPAWEAAGGIANACSFRVTANWNPADGWTDITSNWEVNDTAAYSTLGSAVTESSGIFSFPSTGFWYIHYGGMADYNGSNVSRVDLELQTTHNNSTYTAHTLLSGSIGYISTNSYVTLTGAGLIDVDNVSNVKCKLRTETSADTTWHGSSANNQTWITFIRLAST